MMIDINQAAVVILAKREEVPRQRSVLVGITGIDGCGKGYLAEKIVAQLQQQGVKVVSINVDGWLNLPQKRFDQDNPAEHFYEHAIRFDEMFQQLILPLKENRQHRIVADFAEETATEYRKHTYQFEDVDIIVLEGIYLFKRAYRHYFDLSFWVDCTFETALERALQRGQEGLLPAETVRAYNTIYFPAQRVHFARDNPRSTADFIINNDPRIAGDYEVASLIKRQALQGCLAKEDQGIVIVRQEQPEDIAAVRYVNEQAFGRSAEANLVDALRSRQKMTLSLVAVQDGRIVGHILFSPVTIESGGRAFSAVGLAPMAVLPEHQRQGIGSLLVKVGLEECRKAGHECVVVLGHPEYYLRFGFVPASKYGVKCEYDVPDEVFMAIELRKGALRGRAGTAKYQTEFKDV